MDEAQLTPDERETLAAIAAHRYSGLDLRYEGGPHVAVADRLVTLGLATFSENERWAYMVTYTLTDRGRALLSLG